MIFYLVRAKGLAMVDTLLRLMSVPIDVIMIVLVLAIITVHIASFAAMESMTRKFMDGLLQDEVHRMVFLMVLLMNNLNRVLLN